MEDTSQKVDTRVNDILLGPWERPVLRWLCIHMPQWVNSDLLTAIGFFGGILITVGYWFTNVDKNFLWLVDVGFAVNWFGDSLDGSLARYRKVERVKYGYFVDHIVDTLTQTIICIGLGLSPFISFPYALLALVGYLQLGILACVQATVTGVFKVSYGKIGPTEIRFILVGVNTVFYFAKNPLLQLPWMTITLFDLIALVAVVALFAYFIVFALIQAVELYKQDRPELRQETTSAHISRG
jgi:phosphatidylglycerophosphate synthase